jgi:hypothetical protein
MKGQCDRRSFLESSLAASAGLGLTVPGGIFAGTPAPAAEAPGTSIPTRPLGKTGRRCM